LIKDLILLCNIWRKIKDPNIMNSRHNFRQLNIWIEGVAVATETYQTTRLIVKKERYVLSSQFERAAVYIPSNTAESSSRKSDKHFVTYLENALSSAYDRITQLLTSFNIVSYPEKLLII